MDRSSVAAVAGALLMISLMGSAQEPNLQERFARAKQLIESNGADSTGATRRGLERGIAELRKAIEGGYEDRALAYKLLADAYNTLALVYAGPDSQEQEKIFALRKVALERLLELKPDDPRIRAEYARAAKNKEMEITAWRDVVASGPNDADARWSLGMLLVYDGQIDEGVTHLKKMVEVADLYRGQIYTRRAQDALIEKGRMVDAAEIQGLIEKRNAVYLLLKPTLDKLTQVTPGDGRMRAELARVVKDPASQVPYLQDILAGDPTNSRAMFSLAMVLLYDGQLKKGVLYLERVLGSADPNQAQVYGRIAQNLMIEDGRKAEAAQIAELMRKRKKSN